MNKDTVIGIGVGVLIGYLLWRRRGLAALGGGGCAGCGGGSRGSNGAGPCGGATGGTGDFAQGAGPVTQGYPQS